MLALHAIQARFGDALLLEYGQAAAPRHLLVDGGPAGTFTSDLAPALEALPGRALDLLVLSHVDNDHAVGLVDLLAELHRRKVQSKPPLVTIARAWHNAFSRTIGTASLGRLEEALDASPRRAGLLAASPVLAAIGEGSDIAGYADLLGIPLNAGFADGVVSLDGQGARFRSENLELAVVGPTAAALAELKEAWDEWLDENEDRIASGEIEPAAMSDRSVPNLSSIMLVAEADGRRMLLPGDGRGDHLLAGLEAAGYLQGGRVHVDLLKLSHHGSDRNVTKGFFERVTADHYVVSADGTHGNPDPATLRWILDAAQGQGRTFTLHATNRPPSLAAFEQEHPPEENGYALRILEPGAHALRIAIA